MSDDLAAMFTVAIEVADQVGFSFPEPGDHLNEDDVWEYHLETADEYGWLLTGPAKRYDGEKVATTYPGWGDIDLPPAHLAIFVDGALAGLLSPAGGTVGGFVDVPVDHVGELEGHLIETVADELDHLGGNAEPWRFE